MNENLDNVKRILGKYFENINELDIELVNRVLKEYTNRLADLMDFHRMSQVNLEAMIDEIREEARYEGKRYNGEERREDSKRYLYRSTDSKKENIDEVENEEKKNIIKTIQQDFESEIEEEKRESLKKFTRRLDDFSESSARTVASYLRRAGYYNFEEVIYDLRRLTRSVVDRNLDEYSQSINIYAKNSLHNIYDEFEHIKFPEQETELSPEEIREANKAIVEENGIDVDLLEDTYRKYIEGELEPKTVEVGGILINSVAQPVSDEKLLIISEDLMQNNKINEQLNLMDSKDKFAVVKREFYDMIMTEEEFKVIEQENKKARTSQFRSYSIDKKEEKLPETKQKNDGYEFEEYL